MASFFPSILDKKAGYTPTLSIRSASFHKNPTAKRFPLSLSGFSEIGI